jgi:hypothetical protein
MSMKKRNVDEQVQGRIQDFKLRGGAHLKKLRRAEGGENMFGKIVIFHTKYPKHVLASLRSA